MIPITDCPVGQLGDLAGDAIYRQDWLVARVLRRAYNWACAEVGWDAPYAESSGSVAALGLAISRVDR